LTRAIAPHQASDHQASDLMTKDQVVDLCAQGRMLLAEAVEAWDLVKVIMVRDRAEALRGHLRVRGAALEVQNLAADLKLDAERDAGEILRAMPKQGPGEHWREKRVHDGPASPSFKDLGIKKAEAARLRRIASVPRADYEAIKGAEKAKGELSTAGVLRVIKAAERVAQAALHDCDFSAQTLRSYCDLLREHKGFSQLTDRKGRPFRTYEAFCVAPPPFGLGHRSEDIDHLIRERHERQVADRARDALPLLDRGAPTKEEREKGVDNTFVRGSTNADYLTARIARDRPDILERMKAGEFPSVRAAALEAGIIKRHVAIPLDPARAARLLRKHFKGEDLEALHRLLTVEDD